MEAQVEVTKPGGGQFATNDNDPSYKWKVLVSVLAGLFIVLLDTTVVNVALRGLQEQYNVDTNQSQWTISLYALALGISTPLSAFFGSKFGLKRVYVSSIALFTVGSLLCGLALSFSDNILWLIVARAIQGIGGGLALPLGSAMLFAAFPPQERGKALGIFGISLVFAPALGPLLGGWLVDANAIPWIFYINVPAGLLAVFIAYSFLKGLPGNSKAPTDWPGIVFSTIGFGSVLYAASIAGEEITRNGERVSRGWTDPLVLGLFAVGAIGLLIFTVVELRVKYPLLNLRLFEIRTFTVANLIGYVGILALFGAEFLLPLYLQILRGKSALETGFFLLPLALVSGFLIPVAGIMADRLGPRLPLVIGFVLLAVNTWQLAQIRLDTDLGWITFLLVVRGVGFALVIQNSFLAALRDVPLSETAQANALVNSTRQVVQAIGVAALATVLTSAITVRQPAGGGFGDVRLDFANLPANLPPQAKDAILQFGNQYVSGLEACYWITFALAVASAALSLLLPGWPGRYERLSATQQTDQDSHDEAQQVVMAH